MKRILFSLLVMAAAIAAAGGGTIAFFNDREASTGNTFTAGTIEIAVNGEYHWSEQFNWDDIKPGKCHSISLEITNEGNNPLKLWKIIKCLETDENGVIEPEREWYDEFNGGAPKNDLDSAIVYEMYVDGEAAVAGEAGLTLDIIKDHYIGLVKLDQSVDPAYTGPETNGTGILNPGGTVAVEQTYCLPEGTGNWAQSDRLTFVMELEARQTSAPEPLPQLMFQDNKNTGGDWAAIADETMGVLRYEYQAPDFNYDFLGVGLGAGESYCLIYSKDPWTGGQKILIDSGEVDSSGRLALTGSTDIGSLPHPDDANYPTGAKLWTIPCDKYNAGGESVGWPPAGDWLFENWPGFINYAKGERPDEEINCDYGEDNGAGAECTDADGDGYFMEASGCESEPGFLGHDDCDDNNSDVNPGAAEICDDDLDNDCDGDIDAADSDCPSGPVPPSPGDIVINEIMQNPAFVSDSLGEWFEIYNNTAYDIELEDCVIEDEGSDDFTVNGSLIILAGDYLVFGINEDIGTNGGVDVDYEYSSFSLANGDDEIILTCNTVEIDRVEYDDGSTFPDPTGASMSLCDDDSDNNDGSNWKEADIETYGDGDYGTPGEQNEACSYTVYLDTFPDIDAQYGYWHDYTTAASNNVAFTFNSPASGNRLSGTMAASNLKPYATYQVKLSGVPTCLDPTDGNDLANEYVGYKGRWTCASGATCIGTPNQRNRTDAQYLARSDFRGDGSECIVGYLVFDYFTADGAGVIEATDIGILSDTSYHVLRCGGGNCGDSGDAHLGLLDSFNPTVLFCPFDKANGEIEPGRGGCNGLTLDSGVYNLKMSLTEECFHQPTAPAGTLNWAEVLVGDIDFTIN